MCVVYTFAYLWCKRSPYSKCRVHVRVSVVLVYTIVLLWSTCSAHYGVHIRLTMVYTFVLLWCTYSPYYGVHVRLTMVYTFAVL